MTVALIAIFVALLLAYALYAARPQTTIQPRNTRRYYPGVRVRAGHLDRALRARAAVRGDDGYVRRAT